MLALRRAALAAFLIIASLSTPARAEVLDIRPVFQNTPVWCWAAVGEMIFRYYDVPRLNIQADYQCGIINGLGGNCAVNCLNCVIPAGQMSNIAAMVEQFPVLVRQWTGRNAPDLRAEQDYSALDEDTVRDEIDAGRPIIAGISPSGMNYPDNIAEHVALIVGYEVEEDDDENEIVVLIVNDPFPFSSFNPYLRAGGERVRPGQYRIAYDSFVDRLNWSESVYEIETY